MDEIIKSTDNRYSEYETLLFFFINHKVIFDYLFKSSYMPV